MSVDCAVRSNPSQQIRSTIAVKWFKTANSTLFVMCSRMALLALVLLSSAVSSAMATECVVDTQNFILTKDIIVNSRNIEANNIIPPKNDPMEIPRLESRYFDFETTRFCIRNKNIFRATNIAFSNIALGGDDIVAQCCPNIACQGGEFTITGDNGATVILSVRPGGTPC